MDDLSENELSFITNTLGLETNPLFNDELNLNTISHDYIKNEDDLFLNNDENWLSGLDNVNSFNQSLTTVNQITQHSIHHNSADQCSISHNSRANNPSDHNPNSILIKKKRKFESYDNSNASFINGLLNNEVENIIEISDQDTNQAVERVRSKNNSRSVVVERENPSVDEEMDKMSLKAARILGKPIKNEMYEIELDIDSIKKESDEEDYATDPDEENDLDEDEEIDELLKFPVSSGILEDQCGSPTELNHLIHDSDSGSSHFDDGYLSSATSTNFNSNNQLLLDSAAGRRQTKTNLLNNQTNSTNHQLFQVHNYSCIKQDKFLHSANSQLANNQQLITNANNQLAYLKHDGLLNGNYTSSNSSLSGSNSSSPTQSPNARKSSNYTRRQLSKDQDQSKGGLRSSSGSVNLNKIQQQTGRGSRSKPITDLHLTDEERRLLNKEGYTDFPMGDNPQLSKIEEKILRKIRRKIRNKRSAQCSRQRKKEYLEELEKKYSKSTNEVQCLKSEVVKLKKENVSLISKLQKLLRNQHHSHPPINHLSDQQSLASNEQLPEICGENHITLLDTNEQQICLEEVDRREESLACLESNGTISLMADDDKLDNLFDMLPCDEFENFDNFVLDHLTDDLKEDGLLHYVTQFDDTQYNDFQFVPCTDYHPQAPIKTSLFILVLCFVLMFVPFLRPDIMDNSLNYLENEIGQNDPHTANGLALIL